VENSFFGVHVKSHFVVMWLLVVIIIIHYERT